MALSPPFVIYTQKQPHGSFGETMNDIRSWLDHHKMQPVLFKAAAHGFEIGFASEDDAFTFRREFGDPIQPSDLPG
jgi:hypothetical protein